MSILIVRHGLSEANNRENYGTPAFGNPDAALMPAGREQASALGELLFKDFGLQLADEPVAVSMMRRTQETAIVAGFRKLHLYSELNEEKANMTNSETRTTLLTRRPPKATIAAARIIIEQPPIERIWITHGLLIATICQELGVYQDKRFIPKFCEIRELPL